MSRVHYGQTGYVGSSKSVSATEAEKHDKFPLTRATKILADRADVSRRRAKESLLSVGPCEWHHVSKFANPTNYYSVNAATGWLIAQSLIPRLPADFESRITNVITTSLHLQEPMRTRHARVVNVCENLANETGVAAETICNIYYECYDEIPEGGAA